MSEVNKRATLEGKRAIVTGGQPGNWISNRGGSRGGGESERSFAAARRVPFRKLSSDSDKTGARSWGEFATWAGPSRSKS